MNERYLQFIWKLKRLPFHQLKTTSNQEILVKNVGIHNMNESGPDFFNGKVIIDGIEWVGTIEIHLKSSDWYSHKHHYDSAYMNVVLHVVFENDCDVFVNGKPLPTLELKKHIDWHHYHFWKRFTANFSDFNCAKGIHSLDRIYIESVIERAVVDRLNRKTFLLKRDFPQTDPAQIFYLLLARTFGSKVNQLPFEEITLRLPLTILKRFERKKQIELIHWTSGLSSVENFHDQQSWISLNNVYNCGNVATYSWKRKGLRPQSRPELRVKQFAHFVAHFDFEILFNYLSEKKQLDYIFEKVVDACNTSNQPISVTFREMLAINAFVPFLWWYAYTTENDSYQEYALKLLTTIKPEQNTIIQKWNAIGITSKNAYETQAFIELYNEHCTKNKCLSCVIGTQLLK